MLRSTTLGFKSCPPPTNAASPSNSQGVSIGWSMRPKTFTVHCSPTQDLQLIDQLAPAKGKRSENGRKTGGRFTPWNLLNITQHMFRFLMVLGFLRLRLRVWVLFIVGPSTHTQNLMQPERKGVLPAILISICINNHLKAGVVAARIGRSWQ